MIEKKLIEIASLTVERISYEEYVFSEFILTMKVSPFILLQLLAWHGVSYIEGNTVLRISDWGEHNPEVIHEIGQILFTSFPRVMTNNGEETTDGIWTLQSVSTEATMEESGFHLPDYNEVKANGVILEKLKLL